MIEAKLLTRTGEYVTTVFVPPMNPMPEILQWGSKQEKDLLHRPIYREGLCYFAMTKTSSER